MYITLWRKLPGETWQKVLCCIVAGIDVLAVLFYGVFPVIESWQMSGGAIAG